ncbi:uncharacterized protein K02A2.6-like [Aedes albopictus]|uniref:Integrase catalytic domain-containing protein n=1 Tax=Aedes albopictus TaxID=7160 RepID=A0ABM1ZFK4_AEDAL
MRAPNKAIKREYFRMPLIDEMKVKLHGARFFTKLDLSNAYYHLELCKESRDLTTFLSEHGLAVDAENWVQTCQICATNGRPEKPTPMRHIFAPQAVWETIALDFNGPYARFGGVSILLIVDYRSRFLFARPVKSTSFEQTKQVLGGVFEREGFPRFIRSDNGPPFNGEDYKKYCSERGIETQYSTPLFPQQNGLVENYMKLVNKAMATAFSTEKDTHIRSSTFITCSQPTFETYYI